MSSKKTRILHRQPSSNLAYADKGDGPYIIDQDGKSYIDASGGAAVSCLGHSNSRVTQAIKDQIDNIAFAHTSFFTTEPAEELAEFLTDRAPEGLDYVYFVSGGSEATESALKLARQYFLEKGEKERKYFIARRQSYHGNTLGALSVGGNMWRRQQFEPILIDADHVAPCYPYRDKLPSETDEQYGQRVANELEQHIKEIGAENVIGFMAEPVVGATSGALVPVPGYFKRIREICDQYGILLILDEVMCGMGRTGTLFACEQEGISPDILTTAKGLGAGYQAIGAMLLSNEIYETIVNGSGFFQHGHTYLAHPTACAAALAVQKEIEENNLLENVNAMGKKLEEALLERFGNHPNIGDIRGRGLFWGLELVADRTTKEPLDPALKIHAGIKKHAMDLGLICYPGNGTIDGQNGNHILLAPPFIIEDKHVVEIADKLQKAVESALTDAGIAA
ncbi:aspartate aminotransferase family protein [Curvivirga aplysinae]|uniref:aspartate aminotransferase family protein n=1 Tax=Curvivirga aplysinae TaxID=2529852 RepID=UPI0012BC554C|nr:aspartate aminotransferase family protein [Curvivirga aplysinae]MTI10684.1 aspartate aminotransferase family protein [Curvivirga aplysinae]